ncbi:MAG: hypothetical protein ACOCTG_01660, partial [Bacteroidota bacterium]
MAAVILSRTDWGREQVRSIAVDQLEATVEGEASIGRIEGNLLQEIRLIDVAIVDEQGEPFLRADTISSKYDLWGLVRQRVILKDLRIVDARLVLNQPPEDEWNFLRIFDVDPEEEPEEEPAGWGDWVELHDVRLIESRIIMRSAWEAPEGLSPAEQEQALREALSQDTRVNVQPVEGGYQTVMEYRALDAEISRLIVAHPDTHGIPIEVESFSGTLQPFLPPAAVVDDFSGNLRLAGDSLFFRDIDVRMPGSHLTGEGAFTTETGQMMLRLSGSPVALADLRWLYPELPSEGGGPLELSLFLGAHSNHVLVYDVDLAVRESEIAGRLEMAIGD